MYAIYIYMVTFTINIPQMLAYIAYMDPMGISMVSRCWTYGLKHMTHSWTNGQFKLILSTRMRFTAIFFDQEKLLKRETHGFLRQQKTTRYFGIWLDVFVGFIPKCCLKKSNVSETYGAFRADFKKSENPPFLSHFWIRDAIHGKSSSYGGSPYLKGNLHIGYHMFLIWMVY